MSYNIVEELPPQVRKAFTFEDAEQWMERYNFYSESFTEELSTEELPTCTDYAYYNAWMDMKLADSSRSFTAQVVVEDVDVYGETPLVNEYARRGLHDIVRDGGIGLDKHSSKNVWCVWDVMEATDNRGRPSIVIQGNFFRDKPIFDESWTTFLKGRSQFSLGSYVSSKRNCNAFKCSIEVSPAHWFEISIVDVGASPNTGIIDVHVPEGEGEMNFKNTVSGSKFSYKDGSPICPIRFALEGLEDMLRPIHGDALVIDWIDGVGALVRMSTECMGGETIGIIDDWSEGVFSVSGPIHSFDMSVTKYMLTPLDYFTPLDENSISKLIVDEEEAIMGYDKAIEEAKSLFGGMSEHAIEVLNHIRMEEEEHIRELVVLSSYLNEFGEDTTVLNEEGEIKLTNDRGKMDTVRNCPAGQHSHPGIEGCHDVMRVHSDFISGVPQGKIDLTDEQIDVNYIKDMPTARLKAIVLTIAKTISKFDQKNVEGFMSSSGGKEFSLMFTELVNRKKATKGDNMKDMEKDKKVALKESIDPVTDLSALITIIADMKTQVEHLTSIVQNAQGTAMASEEQSGNIADAVTTAVESIDGGVDDVGEGVTSVGNAEGGDETIDAEPKDEVELKGAVPGVSDEESEEEAPPEKGEAEEPDEEPTPKEDGEEPEGEGGGEEKEDSEKKEEGEEEESDEKDAKKVAEKSADDTPEEEEEEEPKVKETAGIVDQPIPEVPCDAPETKDYVPEVEISKDMGGEGGEAEIALKDGSPKDMVLPVEIPKGPIETKLEEVSKTPPTTDDDATWETGLEDWVGRGRVLLKGKGSVDVQTNPLETRVEYKTASEDVIVVPPADIVEGTGMKLSETGRTKRDFTALWSAIGSDKETFSKIKNEVLR